MLCLLLACAVATPGPLHGAPTREITVGTRWPQLIATNGKVFRNVKFTFVSPREVRFMHTDGIGSLPLSEVVTPDDVTLPVMTPDMPPELTLGPLGSMMTPQERKVSGIDKLSNDEQSTLAQWVRGTVEDRLKEELERRGLPPTFTGLPALTENAGIGALQPAAPAFAPTTAPAAATPHSTAAVLPSSTMLMAPAPTKTYVPPSPAPLLPPPASAVPSAVVPGSAASPPVPGILAGGRRVKTLGGVVESSIDGEFRGLDAERSYRLENGQVWRQQDVFEHKHAAYEPRVTIYPADGGWMMKVDGVEKAVRVVPLN
ncbi:MAG: hypothetical protein ACO1TE_29060 [Prosthecobacter sp.]